MHLPISGLLLFMCDHHCFWQSVWNNLNFLPKNVSIDVEKLHIISPKEVKVKAASLAAFYNSSNLQAIKGIKLESPIVVLAIQPKELHGTIIAQSKVMLHLHASIKQREMSHLWFNKPTIFKDPCSGDPMRDKSGAPKTVPFTPRAFLKKCPVQSSASMSRDVNWRQGDQPIHLRPKHQFSRLFGDSIGKPMIFWNPSSCWFKKWKSPEPILISSNDI